MTTAQQQRLFQIFNISAEITDSKVTDLYIFFSVKGHVDKHKAHTVTSQGSFSWNEHTIEIEIPDPIHASLEVKAFSKRAVLPDRLLGEFALTLSHPGATANLSGDLAKKGGSNGSVSFKIRPKSSKAASKHGEVVTNRHSAYPSSQTLSKLPSMGTAGQEGRNVPDQARDKTAATSEAAAAKTNATAAEAEQRSNQVAGEAQGKTVATVNKTEQKLQDFKEDLEAGKHLPHHHEHPGFEQHSTGDAPAGTNTGQGAFSRTVGIPPEAGTASNESGTMSSHNLPYDASSGGASGAIGGPVAPTGQGGLLATTGGNATGPEKNLGTGNSIRAAAVNAADKAQGAMQSAKQTFTK